MLKFLSKWIFCALSIGLFSTSINAQNYPANSPVALNGKLKVSGTQLVNECGNPIQLRGMSTHGPQWFRNCYSEASLDVLVKDWGISIFRLAMYVEEQGYITNPSGWRQWIDSYVDYCGQRGIYCLIDWHVLNPGNPNAHKDDAIEFWKYMSQKHGQKAHVLYEICNEPNGVGWSDVKNYATDVVKAIRDNNDNTVIIIGTPTWSQDVDIASSDKVNGTNIMYTLHFYAGSHRGELRSKAQSALNNNAPIFVTEFGTSHASGDANYSPDETKTWISWLNERKISWVCWSFSDKGEVSATLVPGSCDSRNWSNLSECGQLIKGLISENKIPFTACDGNNNNGGDQNQNNNNNGGDQNQNNNNNGGDQNQNNNNNGGDQNQNNNNNGGDQNQNNNNNGGDQNQNNNNNGGDQNQNNNNNGGDQNQNNNQQQDDPVSYPTLVQNIKHGDVYRIVNKKSGKVMTIENGSDLKQVKRDENDKKQMFRLKETDGYYFIQNDDTRLMLTNKYVNNDGTKISQEEISEYDNPSQKWSIKKVNEWFTFSNKSDYSASKVLSVENASKQDNADVVIYTSNNQDEQLWGLEYVYTPTAVDNILFKDCVLTPTVINNEFHIVTSTGEETIVDIYTPNGVHCKHIEKECTYDVSDLAKGNYIVVVSGLDGNRILTQLIFKK